MIRLLTLSGLILTLVSGCGVDGEPTAPAAKSAAPGISVSGDARFGVVMHN